MWIRFCLAFRQGLMNGCRRLLGSPLPGPGFMQPAGHFSPIRACTGDIQIFTMEIFAPRKILHISAR